VSVVAQALEDLALGLGNAGARAQILDMGGTGIVDQGHRRRRQLAEVGDLAEMVHAHLDHRIAVLLAQAQQHQRYADMVVEVATGGEDGLGANMLAQHCGNHFLDRGLAAGASQGDQGQAEATAPECRQLA